MIISDNYSSKNADIFLSEATIKYTQELDCCQSEKDYVDGCQILTLSTGDGGGGKFIRINTGEAGWSIGDIDEFIDVLNDFKQRYKCE